ncbi:MAG: hypothetical protein M1540_02660 [Candidatus Bathyarchaeota archaeon]|nr:hypothetical protein [Candidatus Bathyarchaeota archaeon]
MNDKDNSGQVCVEFIGEFKEKFEALKKYYGIQNDAELVRVLINEKARHLNVGPMEAITIG